MFPVIYWPLFAGKIACIFFFKAAPPYSMWKTHLFQVAYALWFPCFLSLYFLEDFARDIHKQIQSCLSTHPNTSYVPGLVFLTTAHFFSVFDKKNRVPSFSSSRCWKRNLCCCRQYHCASQSQQLATGYIAWIKLVWIGFGIANLYIHLFNLWKKETPTLHSYCCIKSFLFLKKILFNINLISKVYW